MEEVGVWASTAVGPLLTERTAAARRQGQAHLQPGEGGPWCRLLVSILWPASGLTRKASLT